MHKRGRLVLGGGLEVVGNCLYEGEGIIEGELVFSTSTTGYTEILTDPSFYGQIVILAYPEVGNYGVNFNDFQSSSIKVKGLVVRNLSSATSSFRANMTLADFMLREEVPILYGVDTRALIAHVRDHGAKMAVMTKNTRIPSSELLQRARVATPLEEHRLSEAVSVRTTQAVAVNNFDLEGKQISMASTTEFNVVAMDFGIKRSLIRYLQQCGATVTLVPSDCTPEEIWALEPDGLFLSNGPGDPSKETRAVSTVKSLLGKLPIYGVCMGHQILAQALGQKTYKLKFGHRGSNQAVRRAGGGIITTAQNHGFAVKVDSSLGFREDINVSDGTNEGIDVPTLHAFSVQFHPEGAPGPLDSLGYFAKFASMMRAFHREKKPNMAVIGGERMNSGGGRSLHD